MKAILPGAMFIGFTGTPLLKADKQTSIEIFGRYIHTYKFDEAVKDGVVLDLRYEARDIDQSITSPGEDRPVVRGQDQGPDRPRQGAAQEALGHDAEGAVQPVAAARRSSPTSCWTWRPSDRLKSGRGNAMLVARQHLPGLQVLRAVRQDRPRGQVRHRHLATRRSAGDIKGEETRRGRDREAAPVRHLPADAGRLLRRAAETGGQQGRGVREGRSRRSSSKSRGR